MNREIRNATALIAVFVVVLLVGQIIVYGANPYDCEVSATRDGTVAEITVDTNYSLGYTLCSLSTESTWRIERYAAFYDDAYPVDGDRAVIEDAIKRLRLYLSSDHVDLEMVDAGELAEIVRDRDATTAVLFATGVIPAEIYSGNASDPLFDWLSAGGTMYWLHGKIGRLSGERNGPATQIEDSDTLFFGCSDVVNPQTDHRFVKNLIEGSLTDKMGIYYGETTNGLDASKLSTPHLVLDYCDGTYSAVSMVRYHDGPGSIVVFGGQLKYEPVPTSALASVAQVVASRMSYDTELEDWRTGSGSGTYEMSCREEFSCIYMYVGEVNAIWAMCAKLRIKPMDARR